MVHCNCELVSVDGAQSFTWVMLSVEIIFIRIKFGCGNIERWEIKFLLELECWLKIDFSWFHRKLLNKLTYFFDILAKFALYLPYFFIN